MSFDYLNNSNTLLNYPSNIYFGKGKSPAGQLLTDPINTISDKIEQEKNKKSTRNAFIVGGVVTLTIALTTLLNPRYSSKFAQKMQNLQGVIAKNLDKNSNRLLQSKFYKFCQSAVGKFMDLSNFVNNFNPFKDIIFKNFCLNGREFNKVKDIKTRRKLISIDKKRANFTGKIHTGITKWFDNISKNTVKQRYKKAAKELDSLENFIKQNLNKLPESERQIAEAKLSKIAEIRRYFSEENSLRRMDFQSELMVNLERDFNRKLRAYGAGYGNKWVKTGDHLVKNMYYWPEEIMMPQRNKLEKEGLQVVEELVGKDGSSGLYKELADTLLPYINAEDKQLSQKLFEKAGKQLRFANHGECIEYFDKKRDLIMGSAPTDIFSALISLIISGAVIASTDENRKKVSRLITGVIPALGAVGTSLVLTSKMISGGKNLLYALLASLVLNRAGVLIDKRVLGNTEDDDINPKKPINHSNSKGEKINV